MEIIMTQEQCNQEYKNSLDELQRALQNVNRLAYRMTDGAKFYHQPESVWNEGRAIQTEIEDVEERFLLFLEDLSELQNTPDQ